MSNHSSVCLNDEQTSSHLSNLWRLRKADQTDTQSSKIMQIQQTTFKLQPNVMGRMNSVYLDRKEVSLTSKTHVESSLKNTQVILIKIQLLFRQRYIPTHRKTNKKKIKEPIVYSTKAWMGGQMRGCPVAFICLFEMSPSVLFEVFNLLVCVVDLEIHLVHFIQQTINGVVLVLNLRLETKSKVLQSAQATAHLIWE